MIIRQEQMTVLDVAAWNNFLDVIVSGLEERYPLQCELMGYKAVRAKTEGAFDRAHANGFRSQNGLKLFAELSILFGIGFDCDPLLPWASGAHSSQQLAVPEMESVDLLDCFMTTPEEEQPDNPLESERVARLYGAAVNYFEQVAGPEQVHLFHAQARMPQEYGGTAMDPASDLFQEYLNWRLGQFYPEKYLIVDEDVRAPYLECVAQSALGYGLTTGCGVVLYGMLTMLLGSSFDLDPQYGFAAEILRIECEPDLKAIRLRDRAAQYLEQFAPAAQVVGAA